MNFLKLHIMKNIATIFALASLLAILLVVGCTKPKNPPAPTPTAPILTVVYTTDSVVYGGTASYSWTLSGDLTAVVTLDGSIVKSTDSRITDKLFESETHTIVATGKGGTVTKNFTIKVMGEKTPTLEVTVSPDTVSPYYSNSVTVSWTSSNAKSVSINDSSVELNGSMVFDKMIADTTLAITAKNFSKTVTVTKTLKVGDWKTSNFGMITHGYWRNTRFGFWTKDGQFITEVSLTDADKAQKWFFSGDFTYKIFNADGTPWGTGIGSWNIDSDPTHFIWGNKVSTEVYTIVELTETSFIVEKDALWGTPEIHVNERYVFER